MDTTGNLLKNLESIALEILSSSEGWDWKHKQDDEVIRDFIEIYLQLDKRNIKYAFDLFYSTMRACGGRNPLLISIPILEKMESREINLSEGCHIILDSFFPGLKEYNRHSEEKSELEQEMEAYPYISISLSSMYEELRSVLNKFSINSFIDCGCGAAVVPFFAKIMGIKECFGIEINEESFRVGQFYYKRLEDFSFLTDIFGNNSCLTKAEDIAKIYHGNAFDHDFGYYDLVYFYQPIFDSVKVKKLYDYVFNSMKVGGIMLEMLAGIFTSWSNERFNLKASYHSVLVKTGKNSAKVVRTR